MSIKDNYDLWQKPWTSLLTGQMYKDKLLDRHNLSTNDISRVAGDVFCYINADVDVTITSITQQWYFDDISLSTVKRAVGELLDKGLIYKVVGSDGRARLLRAVEVDHE